MPLALLDHNGGAAPTTLTANISGADTSCAIAASTSWPSGGANGNFYITINRGQSNEERIKVGSRTGLNLSSLVRGVDGTAATAHNAGESVEHTHSGEEMDDANDHIYATGRDDHTQYLNSTRHAAISHTSAMIGADQVTASQIAANAVGASELADNAVDTNAIANLAVTAGKIANTTITAAQIANATITATQIANDTITGTQIAANAIGTSELADASVDTAAIVDLNVTSAKVAHEAPTSYAVTWTAGGSATTLGNGTLTGEFLRYGRLIYFDLQLVWGSTTSSPAGLWEFSLPTTTSLSGGFAMSALTIMNNSGSRFVGINIVGTTNQRLRVLERITLADADVNSPFTWGVADFLQISGAYIAAS